MKHYILILIIICCCLLKAKANPSLSSDSLLLALQVMPHDTTRMETLRSIIKIEQNNIKCIQYSDTLFKEALSQKNHKYASLAAYYHLVYYYNHNEPDSVAKWLNIMEPHTVKSGLWDFYFDGKRFQIDLYTFGERFELAINEALKMKQKAEALQSHRGVMAAYQCLSNAYIGSQRWEKGVQALEEAYKLLSDKDNPAVQLSVLTQLVSATKEMQENKKLYRYLQELKTLLNNYIAANPSMKQGLSDVLIFNELFFAHYYLNIKQPQLAYEHLVKSKEYLCPNIYFMYQVLYYDTYSRYYDQIKRYKEAIACIDTTLLMLKAEFPSDYAEQLLRKAQMYVKEGEYSVSIPLYQRGLQIKDSISTVVSNKQMDQIKSSYNLDKVELEQAKLNNEIKMIGIGMAIIIACILFIFMYRISKVRRALKRSEGEIRRSVETVRETNEMKDRFLSNMSYNIRTPLNNVVGFSQLIASESDIEEELRREYSDIIHKSSEELMKLVNDVLDLSRLEARMMKFRMQTYDVNVLCNEAIYLVHSKEENAGIDIQFSTNIGEQSIYIDAERIIMALYSALSYPRTCNEKRSIHFSLSTSEDKKMLLFLISNSPLADVAFTSQDTAIRNEINHLLFEHFGGSYAVRPTTPDGPQILFTYPVNEKSE